VLAVSWSRFPQFGGGSLKYVYGLENVLYYIHDMVKLLFAWPEPAMGSGGASIKRRSYPQTE
jgi:hypothetical protein